MRNFEAKLRILFILLLPFVLTIYAWGWWWLLFTLIIGIIASLIEGNYVVQLTLSVLGGIALAAVATIAGFPNAELLNGYIYSIGYWILCFFIIF